MPPLSRKVGLILDRNFGPRIDGLAQTFHVWVVESPTNKPFIQRFWQSGQSDIHSDPLELGITSFGAYEDEPPEATCARLAADLDEHHGDFAREPPWSEIEVFGARLNPLSRQAFEEIGATSFEPTRDGFICRRDLAGREAGESTPSQGAPSTAID